MALKPERSCGGFRHSTVVAFVNEKMATHEKGSEFYLENIALSWEEVEDKLGVILEDSAVSSEAKEACAWGCLALGVRFARRQSQLHERRVKWMHDLAKMHKSAAQTLASDMKEVTAQQEKERQEATIRLKQAQANLAEMRKERDLLRWKLVQTELGSSQPTDWSSVASTSAIWTQGMSEKEAETSGATPSIAGASGRARGLEDQAEGLESKKELSGGFMKILKAVDPKKYSSIWQRDPNQKTVDTAVLYSSGTFKPGTTVPPYPLPVQLPAPFTYSYPCHFPPLSTEPTLLPPVVASTAVETPAHTSTQEESSDKAWPDMGAQGVDPLDMQREKKDPNQQKKTAGIRRPGDWDCPWCKAVNFSHRETCYRCGRAIWLQNPQ